MSDESPHDRSSEVELRPPGDEKIVIALPRAIANMVFIEALPFWILTILGVLGFLSGFVSGKPLGQGFGIWIGSAICGIPGIIGLYILRQTLWRWAIEGRSARLPLSLFSTSSECYLVPSFCSFRLPPSRTSSCRRGAGCSCRWFFAGYSGCWR